MISVRLATRADRPAIRDVARAAFGREEEVALVDRIWTSPEYLPPTEHDPFMMLPLNAYDPAIEGEFRYCWE